MQPCIVAEHQESQIQPEPSFLMPFAAPCCSYTVCIRFPSLLIVSWMRDGSHSCRMNHASKVSARQENSTASRRWLFHVGLLSFRFCMFLGRLSDQRRRLICYLMMVSRFWEAFAGFACEMLVRFLAACVLFVIIGFLCSWCLSNQFRNHFTERVGQSWKTLLVDLNASTLISSSFSIWRVILLLGFQLSSSSPAALVSHKKLCVLCVHN